MIVAEELKEATEKAEEIIQKGIVCSFRPDGCMWEGRLECRPSVQMRCLLTAVPNCIRRGVGGRVGWQAGKPSGRKAGS